MVYRNCLNGIKRVSNNLLAFFLKLLMLPQIFIDKLSFNDGSDLKIGHSDIIIFTGANNAGKSQVLKDIDLMMESNGNKGLVATFVEMSYVGDIKEREDDFKSKDGKYRIGGNYFNEFDSINNWWSNKHRIFTSFYKNRLSTEMRLQASNNAPSFDALYNEPTMPVQMLYLNDKLEEKLSVLFHEAFNEYLIVNRVGGNTIPIHVGQPPVKDAGEDRVSKGYLDKLRKLPILQNQGDGMRSFAGILLDVFTTQKTVTMIDEPEAFLHPPQARLLGRMFVKNKPNDRQLFISTHSEDFLKGLLDADSNNVKIVRINRKKDVNHIKVLDNEGVKNLWKDSILRYSNILSGLFHSKVVICESDTDCRFYQAIMNSIYEAEGKTSPDILFTHCGGKERFKSVIPALTALNVKTVVVPDIDVLNEEATFKTISALLDIKWDDIGGKWKTVFEYVKGQRAQLNTDEARTAINEILDGISTPQMSQDDIEAVKGKLKASTAWSKVKEVGKYFFSGDAYSKMDELLNVCKSKGMFIVPVGELESFYKPLASKANHGTKWVNAVMQKDLANDPELIAARKFVAEIVAY